VYGYARVSTQRQADDGYGLDAQEAAIRGRYPEVAEVVRDAASGGVVRPALERLVDGMQRGDTLVASKIDRLGRDTIAIVQLAERARREGWTLVALDLGLDTSTPMGEFALTIFAAAARMERRMIGLRTAEGIAERRAAGANERDVSDADRARIVRMWRSTGNVAEVCRRLRAGEMGGVAARRWHRTTVSRVLRDELGVPRGPLRFTRSGVGGTVVPSDH